MTIDPGRIEGLQGLRRIDPVEADVVNLILLLLNAQPLDGGEAMSASRREISGAGWFETGTGTGTGFRIVRADGRDFVLQPNRIDDAVAALEASDSLIDRIEALLGLPLEPTGLLPGSPEYGLGFRIETPQHCIDLALPLDRLDLAHLNEQRGRALLSAHDMPCAFDVSIIVADLPIDDAADLEPGDLVLMGQRVRARLAWHSGAADGLVNLAAAHFAVSSGDENDMSNERPGGFSVPVTISLPPRTTSVEALAGLKPGSSLALGPIVEGLRVAVAVGGRQFAAGEIVQIGDQFAVLIESRAGMDDLNQSGTRSDDIKED